MDEENFEEINNSNVDENNDKELEQKEELDNENSFLKTDKIIEHPLEDEMKKSYLDYAMSVIISRALPDVRDGLKPVHRRILFAMHELGLTKSKPFKKCARIVGEVLGKYHPHGDSAVYESAVRMAQDFSMRYPLINGQGNFGSIDGDGAAAMRYTEARMEKLTEDILCDIDKETVDFVDNFDGSEREPSVLPTKIPLLLANGAVGIAVGMATNIPPHNLSEISKATIELIKNPELEDDDLLEHVSGPDFPTGGIIFGKRGIESAYKTGRGKIKVRAKTHVEETAKKVAIIIDEIPYQVNKADLVIDIARNAKEKIIEGISDIRDESDRQGMRVVIELKKDANPEVVLNQIFKRTRAQVTFGIILLCLDDNVPKTLTLKQILTKFISHRKEVVTKRTQFDLTKAEKQAHVLLGLKVAIENLDKTIKIVKESESAKVAKENLIAAYSIDEVQAQAVLDMRLQKLTGLERDKLIEDYNNLLEKISDLKSILDSDEKKYNIIIDETQEEIDKYGDERKTEIYEADDEDADIDLEALIKPEEEVVTITNSGYIKRVALDTYKAQGRGGKGIIATGTKEEDFVEKLFVANTHSYILCFTNFGQIHWMKVYQIPEGSRQSRGKAIVNLLPLNTGAGEHVTTIIPVKEFKEGNYLILVTKQGIVKKSLLTDYSKPRNGGVRGIVLDDGDELVKALMTEGNNEVMIATANGIASRMSESDIRPQGRATRGSRGINLSEGDRVIGGIVAEPDKTILTVTENGYGKRTPVEEYRLIRRGGKGVTNIKTSDRNGNVVSVMAVEDEDELMLISKNGIVIRTRAQEVSCIGRNTQGVRLMRLKDDDKTVSATKVVLEDEEEIQPTTDTN